MPMIWLFARDRLGWIIFAAHNWNVWVYFEYDDLNKKNWYICRHNDQYIKFWQHLNVDKICICYLVT